MRDWEEIRRAAENGESLRSLAERYQIPGSTIYTRAAREGWRGRDRRTATQEQFERIGRKLLGRIENALDEGREIDLKELKAVTGAIKELQGLQEEKSGEGGGTLTVRFVGETEEMSR